MTTPSPVSVSADIRAPLALVWTLWTDSAHIVHWNAASHDWHTPRSTSDLREGGRFCNRMEAKDGSFGFDFEGTYTKVVPHARIEFAFGDRSAVVTFEAVDGGTRVVESFVPETENPVELQVQGWQAILDNFKRYAESKAG